jgi:hypothetical protein
MTVNILNLSGKPAVTVGLASHRQCEVLLASGAWKAAASGQEAMRFCRMDENTVRLRADARVLVEDVLVTAIPFGGDSLALVNASLANPQGLDELTLSALQILQGALQ